MNAETFTKEYFIEKFEAIPEEEWTEGDLVTKLINEKCQRCALGHCGMTTYEIITEEAEALSMLLRPLHGDKHVTLFESVYRINDAFMFTDFYELGDTPKERILNALAKI